MELTFSDNCDDDTFVDILRPMADHAWVWRVTRTDGSAVDIQTAGIRSHPETSAPAVMGITWSEDPETVGATGPIAYIPVADIAAIHIY